jgi:hypothetical protein
MADGYHLASSKIRKGELGEISKIQEELDELTDAMTQNCRVMALLELSDLIGAIELFLEENFSGFTIEDLLTMQRITKRAFLNGARS